MQPCFPGRKLRVSDAGGAAPVVRITKCDTLKGSEKLVLRFQVQGLGLLLMDVIFHHPRALRP